MENSISRECSLSSLSAGREAFRRLVSHDTPAEIKLDEENTPRNGGVRTFRRHLGSSIRDGASGPLWICRSTWLDQDEMEKAEESMDRLGYQLTDDWRDE